MKVVTAELKTSGLTQAQTCSNNLNCVAVLPYLVKYGSPSGSLKIEVYTAGDVLLAQSESINCSSISAESYFHGFVRFYVNVGLTKDSVYKFKLVAEGGYTFSELNYIGWGNTYEDGPYEEGYVSTNSFYKPLKMQIWNRKTK